MADDRHDDLRARLAAEPTPKMPEDVAARVQAALERESRAREEENRPVAASAPASVTTLRRPGRWKAPLLAAAGVVAVVAIAVPVINDSSNQSDGDGGSSAGSSFDTYQGNEGRTEAHEAAPDLGAKADGSEDEDAPITLRSDSFAADVRTYVGESELTSARRSESFTSDVRCVDGAPRSAAGLDVTLDGDPAVLLVDAGEGGRSDVRAVVCGPDGPEVAARASVR